MKRHDGTNPRARGTNPRALGTNPRGGLGGNMSNSKQEQLLGKDNTETKNPQTPTRPAIRAALETTVGFAGTNAEKHELELVVRSLAAAGGTGEEVRRRVKAWPDQWEPPTWKSIEKKWTYLGKLAGYAEKPYPGLMRRTDWEREPENVQSVDEFLAANGAKSLKELVRRKS